MPSPIKVPEIVFEEHILENNLHLLIHQQDHVPLTHVSVHYRIGSSYEKPGFSGLAHLFEHMMFQGSENVGKNEHGRYVDNAGGQWNASTGKDRTNYYETIPSHYLELALWLEADRMRSLNITPENFENQRKTVIEEKKQTYDNRPYGLATLRFEELAYTNWAYGHSIIGEVKDLEKCTLQDAVDFHHTFYGSGNAILVLAGDLSEIDVLEKVRKYFSDISDHTERQNPYLEEPRQVAKKSETIQDPLATLPAIYMGYHMPELGSPEYYALSMLALILSQGESSRFYRQFIHDNNWVTSFSVGPNQNKGPELFYIWAQVQSGIDVDRVVQAIEKELSDLGKMPITEVELEKARNQTTDRFVGRLTKIAHIGELLAHYALFFENANKINSDLDRYLAVTQEDILKVAQQVFCPENQTLIIVEPAPITTNP
ncbi:MAG: pitrilysin family protein [Acidobacteriota bacterium]|nr:pitrilysin family protein [Acidobacteriota bacterium]